MAQGYIGEEGTEQPFAPVEAGDTVYFRARGKAGVQRDVAGRWPHLVYRPGFVGARACEPMFQPAFLGQASPTFRDDGALTVPFPGQLLISGGIGEFEIDFGYVRNRRLGIPSGFPWKLTHFSDGARVVLTGIADGAQYCEVTAESIVGLYHGSGVDSLIAVPGTKVYLQSVTRIEFQPQVADTSGQLILHGII